MNTRQAGKKEVKKHESRDKGVKVSRAKENDRFQGVEGPRFQG
jgi:hypothetical protein